MDLRQRVYEGDPGGVKGGKPVVYLYCMREESIFDFLKKKS